MQHHQSTAIAIIGAGIAGISAAFYLSKKYGFQNLTIIDPLDPMSLTSAQSGENYRNWWPHPVMTDFTNDSITLMEEIAVETRNRINMTRRGYALVTRREQPSDLIEDLYRGYGSSAEKLIRFHRAGTSHTSYQPPLSADWQSAPDGVDVLCDQSLIRQTFPAFQKDVATVLHVRRAGSISGQQLGQFMLEHLKDNGGRVLRSRVMEIDKGEPFTLAIQTKDDVEIIRADLVVNAAGPYLKNIAAMMGEELGVSCVYQQKIAFEDREQVVPRNLPFTIDLDGQRLSWSDEERAELESNVGTARLTKFLQGGIHCRPDGPEDGKWIKLGWAINNQPSDPHAPEPTDDYFPDIVLRAASRLQPGLSKYVGRLPRGAHHYGGYYTMTDENWPLIGPMRSVPNAFVIGALSGFGTMAACMSGSICADWIADRKTVHYAKLLSPSRADNPAMMEQLARVGSRGHL
jgi:glycine/D-amino acid oxidase-like deaminating enzyme